MKKAVVIVAGGSGSRMKSNLPKQFIELSGKPILMHTIECFLKYDRDIDIILVLPKEQVNFWDELCKKHNFSISLTIVYGGETRFNSVKNGLEKVSDNCIVGIHDGVRPLVSLQTLQNCYATAEKYGSAIPVTDAIESIRQITESGSISVARDSYKMVQTPQVFNSTELKETYEQSYSSFFTDDASVFESAGNKVKLTQGNRENIKITTPMDLILGEAILNLIEKLNLT